MMRIVLALLFCVLAGAAQAKVDMYGNILPPECNDLSAINVPIHELTREEAIAFLADKPPVATTAKFIYGFWWKHEIYIVKGLSEPLRSYVILHEKCHEAYARTHKGNPHFH